MANIKWLINNVGWNADTINIVDGAIASGSNIKDVITGPRSNLVRTDTDTGDVLEFDYRVTNWSTTPTKLLEASHCVVTRWDKLVNHQYESDQLAVKFGYYKAGVYAYALTYDLVGDTDWTMMGPTNQDYCFDLNSSATIIVPAFSVAVVHGAGSTAWAIELNQLHFANAFDPGTGPNLEPRPTWHILTSDAVFTPMRSARPYEVEAEITLSWANVTNAKRDLLDSYYGGDECILNWPLFLYDESQTLWKHKLEHVVLVDYSWSKRGDGLNDLTCRFYRLRHYP